MDFSEKWWIDNKLREKRIKRLRKKGYSPEEISKKTGYKLGYVRRVIFGYTGPKGQNNA